MAINPQYDLPPPGDTHIAPIPSFLYCYVLSFRISWRPVLMPPYVTQHVFLLPGYLLTLNPFRAIRRCISYFEQYIWLSFYSAP